jgi:hypothetical protein
MQKSGKKNTTPSTLYVAEDFEAEMSLKHQPTLSLAR